MSGHSKWNNIKRRKNAQDAVKGKVFTKLGKEIQMAVKSGGPDPEHNRTLADAIDRAKAYNMPNNSINRSIKRASGSDAADYEEIFYEGYGPGGVAVMVRCLSDNRNRTAGQVRYLFDRHGGNLGENGSVSFLFERKGVLVLDRNRYKDEDTVMMEALDAGASDLVSHKEYFEVITQPEDYHQVLENMKQEGYEFLENDLTYRPLTFTHLEDEAQIEAMDKLLEALDEEDDVNDVWHNLEEDED